jgi:hypothetical protein
MIQENQKDTQGKIPATITTVNTTINNGRQF